MIDISLFENGINGDFFLGRGSGNKIKESIENAQRRIWVMSPYISSETVNLLLKKYDRDVNIKVFTNEREVEKIRKGQSKVSDFIVETGTADHKKLTIYIVTLFSSLVSAAGGGFIVTWSLLKKPIQILDLPSLLAVGLFVLAYFLLDVAFKTRFMNYSYATRVPIYFMKDPYTTKTTEKREDIPFVHSKIYLIDDEVFFGSMNFTNEGFTSNIETRFRTSNGKVVQQVVEMFLKIQHDEQSMVDIPTLGYRVFHSKREATRKKF